MALKDKLEVWRNDLIDMSRRNSLLYYRLDGRFTSGLALPNADALALYQRLVRAPKPKPVEIAALRLPDSADDPQPARQLERLRLRAREDLKEAGLQTLYIVFGMLNWTEAERSEERVHSPLVLVPVTFQRAARGGYELAPADDETVEINPILHEMLARNFGVALPTWSEVISTSGVSEGATTSAPPREPHRTPRTTSNQPSIPALSEALASIQRALECLDLYASGKWAITPDVYLGRFSFTKLVMREDLRRHEAEALVHPVLRRLSGERGALPEPKDLLRAEQLDDGVNPRKTLAILDADSSQGEAIQAAIAGQSFVLQGPPGTGKSQTIANIIAESLARGRKVLFVSQKMAALDVVRKRLNDAGLGDFLLDLHDNRRNKKEFTSELLTAVTQATIPPGAQLESVWENHADELKRRREQLNSYVRELHTPRFALEMSAFIAHGELARRVSAPTSDAPIANVTQLTTRDLDERRDALRALLDYTDVLDYYSDHLWRSTPLTSLSGDQRETLDYHFGALSEALVTANEVFTTLGRALGETVSVTLEWANHALKRTTHALTSPMPPQRWLDPGSAARLRPLFQHGMTAQTAYREARQALDDRYQDTVYTLDHGALLQALVESVKPALPVLQIPVGADGRDAAIEKRDALDTHLRACVSLPTEIGTSAAGAAALLGQPVPTTLARMRDIARQADVISRSPIPPKSWLDADAYAEARIAMLDAVERANWAAGERAELEKRYIPSYLSANLSAISARFRESHSSLLRFLNPQYYLDILALRRYVAQETTVSQRELGADSVTLARLRQHEEWLHERRADHARILGRYYLGDQMDWAQVRVLIVWIGGFYAVFGDQEAPDAPRRLALASDADRAPLTSASRMLAQRARQWAEERAWIDENLDTSQLMANENKNNLDLAPLSDLSHSFERIQAAFTTLWRAVDIIAATLRTPTTPLCNQMEQDLTAARTAHAYTIWLAEHGEELDGALYERYQGIDTKWATALTDLDWTVDFIALYPDGVPAPLAAWISTHPDCENRIRGPLSLRDEVRGILEQAIQAREAITAEEPQITIAIGLDQLAGENAPFIRTPFPTLKERTNTLRAALPQLERWISCAQAIARCRSLGAGAFVDAALRKQPFTRDIVQTFERRFYTLWLDAARHESPILDKFTGDNQASVIKRFRALDKEQIAMARARLVNALRRQRHMAFQDATASDIRDKEFRRAYDQMVRETRKQRHRSIRGIIKQISPALIILKPCWLMSPLSVSQFVGTAEPIFDLVIFDEASQVLPEDAICAILRGKQLIVAGDDQQLPPTNFFNTARSDDDDDDDDADGEEGNESAESERTKSLLDELLSANFKPHALMWHYRSRHESLIAFSNHQFYRDQLITFPGPESLADGGVRFVSVTNGVYDRGKTRTNRREAERVVDELLAIVERDKDSSIGVVALSGAQQRAIREALENRLNTHPELVYARERLDEDSSAEDGFFIKNLETVQGDERDIILLSVGYGKDAGGHLSMNFGPINKPGGERRLNVAVTRAKQRLIVVTSIHAGDFTSTITNLGAKTLRRYLAYAENGPDTLRTDPLDATGGALLRIESPFEQAVYEALTAHNLQVDTQIGCSGYRIDLAIRDDQRPDRYVLGIECDGATYHSSKTARDRDRLRQAHLETLGWRIHRIWSSDWIADPNREIAKTLDALRLARMRLPLPQAQEGAS